MTSTDGTAEKISPDEVDEEWLPDGQARLGVANVGTVARRADGAFASSDHFWVFEQIDSPIKISLSLSTAVDATTRVGVSIAINGRSLIDSQVSSQEGMSVLNLPTSDQVLSELSNSWPFLEWEQATPWENGLDNLASLLNSEGVKANAFLSSRKSRIAQRNQDFVQRHDLAKIFAGAMHSRVLGVRRGNLFVVLADDAEFTLRASDVFHSLEALGDKLTELVPRLNEDEVRSVEAWKNRRSISSVDVAEIATGIASEKLHIVNDLLKDIDFLRPSGDPADSELYAAARMSAAMSPEDIAQVVHAVTSSQLVVANRSLGAVESAASAVDLNGSHFEVGYELASWYRQYRGLSNFEPVDPESELRSLGVEVRSMKLASTVDAIAVWGPNYGPAVVINLNGLHSRTLAGRRATLAHELAHVLLDRQGALPLVEVLGGRVVESVEARARAFAAELLLPRDVAGEAYSNSPDKPKRALGQLTSQHGVSKEVAAWQIRNSGVSITSKSRSVLRRYVKRPESF